MPQTQQATEMAAALEELLRPAGGVLQESSPQVLLADPLRFRYQLAGGDQGQPKGHLADGAVALGIGGANGAAVTGIKSALWYAQQGLAAKVLAVFSKATLPWASLVGLGAATGLGVGLLTYGGLRLWRRRQQALYSQVPRYLSLPLNTAALAVASLLTTPALQVVQEVSTAPRPDQAFLAEYLSQEWGFEPTVAQTLVEHWGAARPPFVGPAYRRVFVELVRQCPEVHRDHLRQEILSLPERLPSSAGQKLLAQTFSHQLQSLLN
jgi:hypothetical protein